MSRSLLKVKCMNLKEIISNELNNEELNNNDETYVFEEGDGLFSISPLIKK